MICTCYLCRQPQASSHEKDEAIAILKHELNKSIDTFEGEQDKAKKMGMDMLAIQRELTHIKSQKQKSDERVDVLQERIKNAEARVRMCCSGRTQHWKPPCEQLCCWPLTYWLVHSNITEAGDFVAQARNYSAELQAERENKSDSNEAVEKLQHVITTLKHEKDCCHPRCELGAG